MNTASPRSRTCAARASAWASSSATEAAKKTGLPAAQARSRGHRLNHWRSSSRTVSTSARSTRSAGPAAAAQPRAFASASARRAT